LILRRVVVVSRDLLFASHIAAEAERRSASYLQIDEPAQLPPARSVDLVLIDWDGREPGWGEAIVAWHQTAAQSGTPTVVLYGPHTDLSAHADARATGLGPMWARSKLLAELPRLLSAAD
jgi:hypothetical protein